MTPRKAYYRALGLKDGTVFVALPIRKPGKKGINRNVRADPEGVCFFDVEEDVVPRDMPDWLRTTFHTAVATSLNMKRLIRKQVSAPLQRIESKLEEILARLAAIEECLGHNGRNPANRERPAGGGRGRQ